MVARSRQVKTVTVNLQRMGLEDHKLSDYPDAAALAYAVYGMDTVKPWLQHVVMATMDDVGTDQAVNIDD